MDGHKSAERVVLVDIFSLELQNIRNGFVCF